MVVIPKNLGGKKSTKGHNKEEDWNELFHWKLYSILKVKVYEDFEKISAKNHAWPLEPEGSVFSRICTSSRRHFFYFLPVRGIYES
jgi:hypothetical protein